MYEDQDYLFLSLEGKQMTNNAVQLIFSRLARRSGVKRLHVHLCRHTFATNYLINGGDVFSLQQILGHTSLEMVRRYVTLASAQVRVQHRKFSPMDRMNLGRVSWANQGRMGARQTQLAFRLLGVFTNLKTRPAVYEAEIQSCKTPPAQDTTYGI